MNRRGYTLIELLIVIAMMGILMTIVMPQVTNISKKYEKSKYETYAKSVERAAKLYTESHEKEMFGYQDSGCATVGFRELNSANLVKEYHDQNGSCSTKDDTTYVNVRKIGDQYEYNTAIQCENKGETIIDWKLDENTCTINPDNAGPKILLSLKVNGQDIDPDKYLNKTAFDVESADDKKLTIKVTLEDDSGFMRRQSLKYMFINSTNGSRSKERTLQFNNNGSTSEKTLTKEIPISYILSDINPDEEVFGKYTLYVYPDSSKGQTGVIDSLGNSTTTGVSKPLSIDTKPPTNVNSVRHAGSLDGPIYNGEWTNKDILWSNFTADDEAGIDYYEISTDCTGSVTTRPFEGDHVIFHGLGQSAVDDTVCLRAVDNDQNKSEWSDPYYFRIDKIAPSNPKATELANGHVVSYKSGSNIISCDTVTSCQVPGFSLGTMMLDDFAATDDGGSEVKEFWYSTNSNFTTYGVIANQNEENSNDALTFTGNRNEKYYFKTVDNAGNVSGVSGPYNIHIDNDACIPNVNCISSGSGNSCNLSSTTYGSWSSCSKSCGTGTKTRSVTKTYRCTDGSTKTKKSTQKKNCNTETCTKAQVTGKYACGTCKSKCSEYQVCTGGKIGNVVGHVYKDSIESHSDYFSIKLNWKIWQGKATWIGVGYPVTIRCVGGCTGDTAKTLKESRPTVWSNGTNHSGTVTFKVPKTKGKKYTIKIDGTSSKPDFDMNFGTVIKVK